MALPRSADPLARRRRAAQVKAVICENVNLYLRIAEEEFAPHLNSFATAVWHLLLQARSGLGRIHVSLLRVFISKCVGCGAAPSRVTTNLVCAL